MRSEQNMRCSFCQEKFETVKAKVTHNCPEKPEDICEKKFCGRDQKDGSDYCPAHTNQVWIEDEPEKETIEKEIPVFEVKIHKTVEHRAEVQAPHRDAALEKVKEMPDEKTLADVIPVFEEVEEVDTVTEIEEKGFKEDPPKYVRLDTMEAETVQDREDRLQRGDVDQ